MSNNLSSLQNKWNGIWKDYIRKIRLSVITQASYDVYEVLDGLIIKNVNFDSFPYEGFLYGSDPHIEFLLHDYSFSTSLNADGIVWILKGITGESLENFSQILEDFPYDELCDEMKELHGVL